MEDRRTAIAILLIIMIVMMYSEMVLAPSVRPAAQPAQSSSAQNAAAPNASAQGGTAPAQMPSTQVSPAAVSQASLTSGSTPAAPAAVAPAIELPPTPAELLAAGTTTIETPLYIASVTHLGGRLTSFRLKQHRARLGSDELLDLVSVIEGGVLPLGVYSGVRSDLRTAYAPPADAPSQIILNADQEFVLPLQGTLADGSEIRKTITFAANTYLMGISLALSQPAADGTKAWIEWSRFLPRAMAEDTIDPWTFTSLTDNDKIERTALPELKLDGLSQPAAAQWIALGDKYFGAILVPETRGFNARYGRLGPQYLKRVAGTPTGGTFSLFLGPKDYDLLQSAGTQMERSVDLGFFSFLAYPLLILIRLFHSLFGNYGLAIVGLTLLIKGLFFPLTRASLRSMKALQDLQPEMQALRERIKDPTQLNQELMQLYKRKGVNPLGGCLPILLQIPVFFGLFSALQHSIELRHAPFALWINDLSVPEQFTLLGINIPVMIIIMGVTMFYQQWTTPMPSVDPAQRRMMLWISAVFPISFLIFPFPSGLALYMLTNTSISLVQQAYLRNDAHANPGRATTIASLAIFAVAFALTLI